MNFNFNVDCKVNIHFHQWQKDISAEDQKILDDILTRMRILVRKLQAVDALTPEIKGK